MANEVRHVFDQHQTGAEDGDVRRHRQQNVVVWIRSIVMAVTNLAEAFAGRARCKDIDITKSLAFLLDGGSTAIRQNIAGAGNRLGRVVVVDGDRIRPGVVGFDHTVTGSDEADTDSTHAAAQLDRRVSGLWMEGRPRGRDGGRCDVHVASLNRTWLFRELITWLQLAWLGPAGRDNTALRTRLENT